MPGKTLDAVLKALGHLPIIGGPVRRRAWYPYRHRWVLHFGSRRNETFTQFTRLPSQSEALAGPVVDFLRPAGQREPLRMVVFGCSYGAEPYSMASALMNRRPGLPFEVLATDIDGDMIDKALTGRYSPYEVTRNALVSDEFIATTFIREGENFVVKPEIRARVSFQTADVLDTEAIARIAPADIVIAQNFLYHLGRKQARRAFANLCALLKNKAALFVDGMDIDLRHGLTRRAGLRPLDFLIPEIHEEASILRGAPWPWTYWGLEPLDTARKDWKQRYATIYLQDQPLANRSVGP